MITSMSNPRMKEVQQLLKKAKVRRESGLFAVEGIKMFREAPGDRIEKVYVSSSFLGDASNQKILEEKGLKADDEKLQEVDDRVFKSLSDTVTPQGVLCLVKQEECRLEDMLASGEEGSEPFLMVLEDLQDPGNLGTIVRTGEGAGVSGIILSRNCVDLYNPKVIRSTMGSIYRMKVCCVDSVAGILPKLHECGVKSYAAHLEGENFYDQEDYRQGTAILIGNEGNGLSEETSRAAGCLIKIPMAGQVESLNAAMAAGVLMYEVSRQRGTGRQR